MSIEHGSNSEQKKIENEETKESVENLGNEIHEEWRKSRYREESKDYEPVIRKTGLQDHDGAKEVDIANTKYEDLPDEWQRENKISAEIAPGEVKEAINAGTPLDELFIEAASSALHEKWLERNSSFATQDQKKSFDELPEREKEKDRIIIRKAIKACGKKE